MALSEKDMGGYGCLFLVFEVLIVVCSAIAVGIFYGAGWAFVVLAAACAAKFATTLVSCFVKACSDEEDA